jgi:glycosyltransferase involved in cell wall biosynthesis
MFAYPLVSVILPTYNGHKTLGDALDSLLAQSYENIEIIVIDDASLGGISTIVNKRSHAGKIKYVRNEKNLGLAGSINAGVVSARGQYVARMDDDDYSLPDRIERQVAFLESYKDIDVLGTGLALYDQNLKFIRNHVFPAEHESIIKFLCRGNPLAHPAVMIRRCFLQRSGGYDATLRRMEDLELWGRMANQSKYANLPDILLRHRIRQSKTLSALKPGIAIRLRNGRLLGCFWQSLCWTFLYVSIEVARHWGYRQRAFRHPAGSCGPAPGFTD